MLILGNFLGEIPISLDETAEVGGGNMRQKLPIARQRLTELGKDYVILDSVQEQALVYDHNHQNCRIYLKMARKEYLT